MITSFKSYLMGLGILLLPILSIATPPVSSSEMPRDVWLEHVRKAVPEPVCKSFLEDESIASQMTARNISYDNCVSLVPAIADKCEKKIYSGLPATINDQNAEHWGQLIGECIGNDFAMHYLYSDTSSEEAHHGGI